MGDIPLKLLGEVLNIQLKVSVLVRVHYMFQGLKCMQELFLGKRKGPLIREVSSFQGCP